MINHIRGPQRTSERNSPILTTPTNSYSRSLCLSTVLSPTRDPSRSECYVKQKSWIFYINCQLHYITRICIDSFFPLLPSEMGHRGGEEGTVSATRKRYMAEESVVLALYSSTPVAVRGEFRNPGFLWKFRILL